MERLWLIISLALLLAVPALSQQTTADWVAIWNELFQQGKYNKSLQAFDKAIEMNPNDALAWNNKGRVFDALGRYDEAIKCFDNVRQIENDFMAFGPIILRIPSWIIAPLIAILVAVLGYFAAYFNNLRLSQRDAKLKRVNKQLGELYGPLYALAHISKKLFDEFSDRTGMSGPYANWILTDQQKEEWILWMQTVFMPNNLSIYELIVFNITNLIYHAGI